jgi:hypothetical protein
MLVLKEAKNLPLKDDQQTIFHLLHLSSPEPTIKKKATNKQYQLTNTNH